MLSEITLQMCIVRSSIVAIIVLSACASGLGTTIADYDVVHAKGRVTGELRIHDLESRIFRNTRKLRVLLPPGYDFPENQRRMYPVLYLNDGQNLFDSTTAIFGPAEWRVDETVADLVAQGAIPPMIVVGIDNAGRRGRAHEYLRYPDEFLSPPEPTPRGSAYPDFLAREVVPFVSSRYRVSADPKDVGIGGSSYGGLAALYAAVIHPEIFGLLLAESPSLYVDHRHALRDIQRQPANLSRIYLGVGSNEEGRRDCEEAAAETSEPVTDVRRLERILREKGMDTSRLRVVVVPCAIHEERAWAGRLPAALKFLFR